MLLALVLSAGIGVSLGLLGGGGSILTLPILLYVLHLEPHAAITTSLLVVGVTSLAAMITHARRARALCARCIARVEGWATLRIMLLL